VNAFLLDPQVAAALKKWGVTFHARALGPPSQPRRLASPCTFPESAACMPDTGCCEFTSPDYPGYVEEYVCCTGSGGHSFVDRLCSSPRNPDNPCGNPGPNGCAICWAAAFDISCSSTSSGSLCEYSFK